MPTSTTEVRDAAFVSGIMGYGGPVAGYLWSPRALHPWMALDWAKFRGNRKLPIYVATLNGEDDAWSCLQGLYELDVPRGAWVAYDLEGRVDRTAVTRFGQVMHWADYLVAEYGSVSTLFNNPELDGWWAADWTGRPHMYNHAGVVGTQYANGAQFDTSVFASEVVAKFWV